MDPWNPAISQDHPEEMWRNMYRYYRRKGPKVDVRLVLAVTITLISAGLFMSWIFVNPINSHTCIVVNEFLRSILLRVEQLQRGYQMPSSNSQIPNPSHRNCQVRR